jgi:hypothetical protein
LRSVAPKGRGKSGKSFRDDIPSGQSAALRTLDVIAEHVELETTARTCEMSLLAFFGLGGHLKTGH